jgi:SOS-response transcriptional repressor LexA
MSDPRTYGLTTRAVELLAVIRAFRAQHGRVPTYEEMAADLGVAAKSTVHRLLTQLEARGIVRRLHHKRQSVELIEPRTITLPEDVAVQLRHAARSAGRTPEEHVAALVRHHCPSPSPF